MMVGPLFIAANYEPVEAIDVLLKAGAKVNKVGNNGWTPLHIAANRGNVEAIKLLLKSKAKVDQLDKDGWTPLHMAAQYGHVKVIELLLKARAKVDQLDKDGWTPLHIAAANGRVKVIELLLNARAKVDLTNDNGATPLYIAAINGHIEAMGVLIEAEAKMINQAIIQNDRTPLYGTAANGKIQAVRLLLNKTIDTENHIQLLKNILEFAKSNGHTDIIKLLEDQNQTWHSKISPTTVTQVPLTSQITLQHTKHAENHFKRKQDDINISQETLVIERGKKQKDEQTQVDFKVSMEKTGINLQTFSDLDNLDLDMDIKNTALASSRKEEYKRKELLNINFSKDNESMQSKRNLYDKEEEKIEYMSDIDEDAVINPHHKKIKKFKRSMSDQLKREIGQLGEKRVYNFLLEKYEKKYNCKSESTENGLGFRIKGINKNGNDKEITFIWNNKNGETCAPIDMRIEVICDGKKKPDRHIEVKATKEVIKNKGIAELTRNQLKCMKKYRDNFRIFRVYEVKNPGPLIFNKNAKIFKDPYKILLDEPKDFPKYIKSINIKL